MKIYMVSLLHRATINQRWNVFRHSVVAPHVRSDYYRASYASAVLGVVILSVCPSVRHTRAFSQLFLHSY